MAILSSSLAPGLQAQVAAAVSPSTARGEDVQAAADAGLLKEDRCPEAARQLVAGNPAKGGGIRMVLFNIGKILANPDNLNERGLEDINYLLSEINKDIGGKSGRRENRLGNEIMIDAEDLQ